MLSKNHLSPFLLLILTRLNNPGGCEKEREVALLSIFKHSLMISFFVFVMMLSVLFTTSFVQDGHGMLPLLSYSIKDSILIKAFNLASEHAHLRA
jgi:hypothetical protein